MEIYVNAGARRFGSGTKERPYQTIQQAADIAQPGDRIWVAPGIYRENVNPKHAGKPGARIEYRAIENGKAVITGAEEVRHWEPLQDHPQVYLIRIPNGFFGEFNPYTRLVEGDWFDASHIAHLGEVYLGNKSLYEVTKLEDVLQPQIYEASWDPEATVYTWYTKQDEITDETLIYANFQGKNPNEEKVEINVRQNCFYPQKEEVGFITFSGFTVTKAATQWAPPTACQEGMIGPHWSRGWIIEDCDISHSKCSGISLGKYYQMGNDNKWMKGKYKDGTQTQRDCVMIAQKDGWTKERIGHHIIRRCRIHDCGQTGIVGHLGGAFSLIENNQIYRINNKQNLAGAEIGGIKMHAAIDVIFRGNHIHHCTRGIWLDWEAQGTRVTQNLFHDNTLATKGKLKREHLEGLGEDLFVEVSHGPTLVDHNIFLSERAIKMPTQGLACVHNLIAGGLVSVGIGTDNGAPTLPSARYTPYHVPHGTEVVGFMTILHGDDRFYNNIFLQRKVRPFMEEAKRMMAEAENTWDDNNVAVGTAVFDQAYETREEWEEHFNGYCGMGADPSNRYYLHLPIYAHGNTYLNGAKAWKKEKDAILDTEHPVRLELIEEEGSWKLNTNLFVLVSGQRRKMISSQTLGEAFEPEEGYENPDGSTIVFNQDFFGHTTGEHPIVGPIECEEEMTEVIFGDVC